jgi:hypothetical protein
MGERVYLVVDSVDGRVHHIEFKDPTRIDEVGRDISSKRPQSSPV